MLLRPLLLLLTLLAAPSARAQDADPWWGHDKALHLGAAAALTTGGYALASLWSDDPGPRLLTGAAVGMGAGVAKELLDLAGLGHPSWKDLAWDAIGTAAGLLLSWALDRASDALFRSFSGGPTQLWAAVARQPRSSK